MTSPAHVHRELADAWNRRDFERVRSLLHPQYRHTGPDGGELAGCPDSAIAMMESFAGAFADGRMQVQRVFVHGDAAVAEIVFRGTHTGELSGIAPTGRRIEVRICNVVEVRDGKVLEEREYFDMLHLMSQLGAVSVTGGVVTA